MIVVKHNIVIVGFAQVIIHRNALKKTILLSSFVVLE